MCQEALSEEKTSWQPAVKPAEAAITKEEVEVSQKQYEKCLEPLGGGLF